MSQLGGRIFYRFSLLIPRGVTLRGPILTKTRTCVGLIDLCHTEFANKYATSLVTRCFFKSTLILRFILALIMSKVQRFSKFEYQERRCEKKCFRFKTWASQNNSSQTWTLIWLETHIRFR